MKTSPIIFLILTAMIWSFAACNETVTIPVGDSGISSSTDKSGTDDPQLHADFEKAFNGVTGGDFQLATQVINRQIGGTLAVTPEGWPTGWEVRLVVPPYAFDATWGDSVEFGVSIPVTGDSTGVPSYEFFPDGIQFNEPVTATLCWPTWAGEPVGEVLTLFHLQAVTRDLGEHYVVTDVLAGTPAALKGTEPPAGWSLTDRCTEILFPLPHFSDWSLNDDDSISQGGGKILPQVIQVGDSCWTP